MKRESVFVVGVLKCQQVVVATYNESRVGSNREVDIVLIVRVTRVVKDVRNLGHQGRDFFYLRDECGDATFRKSKTTNEMGPQANIAEFS